MKRIFVLFFFWISQGVCSVFNNAEIKVLKHHFFENIHPNGAIVASPSHHNPNYYYDWIRDSAIAMGLIETWYEDSHSEQYKKYLYNYVQWTETIQHQQERIPNEDILGEPKFYIDGYPYEGPWGRPQNDGPALRASVLIRFAHQLLDDEHYDFVRSHLYNNSLDPHSMGAIKMDLEYISHHWKDPNFDLWEEVLGTHFFTAVAQKKALLDGAELAHRLKDEHAAAYYEKQAGLIEQRLKKHLDKKNKVIMASLPPHPGPQKNLELDSSVFLGLLIDPQEQGPYSLRHFYVTNTINALHKEFNHMFPINEYHEGPILFGRYPGDTYDGYNTDKKGNPWFILTATMAEYYYTLAYKLSLNTEDQSLIRQYIKTGDNYLKLIKKYAPNLYLSEQINSETGIQQGAISLTWSYVSVLRAIDMSEKVKKLHK